MDRQRDRAVIAAVHKLNGPGQPTLIEDPNRSVSPFNSGKHLVDGSDLTPLTGCAYSTLFGHDVRES